MTETRDGSLDALSFSEESSSPLGFPLSLLFDLRTLIVTGLLLSYVWRFHDLTPELSVLRLAALFTAASWGFLIIAPRWQVLRRALAIPYIWLFLLWSAWMFLGIPSAISPGTATEALLSDHLKNVTMVLFVVGFFTAFQHVRFVVAVQLFGAAVLTFYYAKSGFPTWGSPVPYYDRNDFALLIVFMAPLAFFLSLATKNKWVRTGAWVLISGIGISVIWGQSRGGFVALAVSGLFLLFRLKGIRLWVRVLLPVMMGLGILLAPPESRERLETLFSLQTDYNYVGDEGRLEVWKRGVRYTLDHPIFGVGRANFPLAEGTLAPRARQGDPFWSRRSVAHNSVLEVAAETGLVGGALYMSIILTILVRLTRLRRGYSAGLDPASQLIRQFCDCLLASIVGFLVAGFFLSQGYSSLFFSILCMVAGLELTTSKFRSSRALQGANQTRIPAGAAQPGSLRRNRSSMIRGGRLRR